MKENYKQWDEEEAKVTSPFLVAKIGGSFVANIICSLQSILEGERLRSNNTNECSVTVLYSEDCA